MSSKKILLTRSLVFSSIRSWLPVLTIFAGVLIFVICRARIFPLENADEADYMLRGYKYLSPSFGPLYSLWYRFLASLSSDSILIYRFNHGLLLFVSSLLVAVVLYLNGIERTRASLAGAFLLCWYSWTAETFFVNHFNVVLILLALLATTKMREPSEKLLWFGVLTLPTVYCRQNNLPVSLGCLALGAVFLKGTREKLKLNYFASLTLILVYLAMFYVWNPFKGARAFAAFSGNFFWKAQTYGFTRSEFISDTFGGTQSIGTAVMANPQLFWEYLGKNFLDLAHFWSDLLFRFEILPAVALILGILILFLQPSPHESREPRKFLTADLGVVSLLFCASAFLSVLIFGFVFHYYAEAVVFGGMALVWYFSPSRQPSYAKQISAATLIFIGFTYQANRSAEWIRKFPFVSQEIGPIVETLQKIPKDRRKSFVMYDALPMFLGDCNSIVYRFNKQAGKFLLDCNSAIYRPDEKTSKAPVQWLQEFKEFKADVLIFSQSSLRHFGKTLAWMPQKTEVSQLVGSCYDNFEVPVADTFSSVYVRRKNCSD